MAGGIRQVGFGHEMRVGNQRFFVIVTAGSLWLTTPGAQTWILLQAFDRFRSIASDVANDVDGIDH